MTEDSTDQRDSWFTSDSSDEWVDKIAEAEGLSREAVLEGLISSYWTLKEIFRVMEQAEESVAGPTGEQEPKSERFSVADFTTFRESVTTRIDQLQDEIDALAADIHGTEGGTSLEELREEVHEIDTRVEETPTKQDIRRLNNRLNRSENELTDEYSALRNRFDDEFENLETILSYLLDTTDALESDTKGINQQFVEETYERWEQEDRLAKIKQDANLQGITTAKCGYCDTKVDIAVLAEPHCPQCANRFSGIKSPSGWFGLGSATLITTDQNADSPPKNAETESNGFVWSKRE